MKRIAKKIALVVWSVMLVFLLGVNERVYAEESKELNIYAIYLNNEIKGESVLLESKGQYLLMDIGAHSHLPAVIDQLQELGIKELSVYFSHLHTDHIGATALDRAYGLRRINEAGIRIKTLYLPSPELASESRDYVNRYRQIREYMAGKGCIIYLKKGSVFQVGDATGEVIGPLFSSIKPQDYAYKVTVNSLSDEPMYTQYENNRSLVTIFTCGDKRFFTGGDCLEDGARELLNAYKYSGKLDCDIMKLSHHGTGGGNTTELIDAISPEYSFASNTSYADVNEVYGRTLTSTASKRASKHGAVYLVGSQKETLIIQIKNNQIHLYSGKQIVEGKQFVGLKTFKGADGVKRTTNTYYFKEDGHLLTGIQKIDGHYFNFGPGGCMEYGSFSEDGEYKGWKTQNGQKRYYMLSKDGAYAYMQVGFAKLDNKLYSFNQEGVLNTGNADVLTIIGQNSYVVNQKGIIYSNRWFIDKEGKKYYLQSDGTPIKNKVAMVNDRYFIFEKDGVLFIPEEHYTMTEFKGNCYLVCDSGVCKRSFMYTDIDDDTYYFGKNAKQVFNKMVKYHGDLYYVDKDGFVVKDSLVKKNGKTYYFNSKGRMVISKRVEMDGDMYYFDKHGTMVKNKTLKIGKKMYDFNKDGVMKERKEEKTKKK